MSVFGPNTKNISDDAVQRVMELMQPLSEAASKVNAFAARMDTVESEVDTFTATAPTVIAGNYTKRLANYGGDLAAAIADLPDGGANGGEIQVDGEFTLSDGTVLPNSVHVIGRGAGSTQITVPSALNVPAVHINGTSNNIIADIRLVREPGGTHLASQNGILVWGATDNTIIERVHTDGLTYGVRARNDVNGTLTHTNLTLRDVIALNTQQWGIEVSGVDGFVVDNCEGSYSATNDGLKIGGRTRHGKVIGGKYTNNGQEGIDAFTGGQDIQFIGVTCNNNSGSGLIVKTDNVSSTDFDKLAPRNIQVIGGTFNSNAGHGLGVYKMNSGGTPPVLADQIALSQVSISGGEYIGNGFDGIYSDARNVTINGPLVRRNGRHGMLIGKEALYNTINNPVSVGNGTLKHLTGGSYTIFENKAANVWIQGKHIALRGGTLLGVDNDGITDEAMLNAGTKVSTYNVFVDSFADDVLVDPDNERLAISAPGMQTDKTSGTVIFHHKHVGRSYPQISGAHGSVGSTYTRKDAAANSFTTFRKVADAPNVNTGWIADTIKATAVPPAIADLVGAMYVRTHNGTSTDTLHVCIQTGPTTFVWRAVTMT